MCAGAFLAENSRHSNTYIVDSNSPILCAGNFGSPVAVGGHAAYQLACAEVRRAGILSSHKEDFFLAKNVQCA